MLTKSKPAQKVVKLSGFRHHKMTEFPDEILDSGSQWVLSLN